LGSGRLEETQVDRLSLVRQADATTADHQEIRPLMLDKVLEMNAMFLTSETNKKETDLEMMQKDKHKNENK